MQIISEGEQAVRDQDWLQNSAVYWLNSGHVLRWLWNPKTKLASGFVVLGEGGEVVTVKLSDRSGV